MKRKENIIPSEANTRTSIKNMQVIIAYKCNVVHSVALNQLEILSPGLIGVNEHGTIVYVMDLNKTPLSSAKYDQVRTCSYIFLHT
jgi:hypothetical protein